MPVKCLNSRPLTERVTTNFEAMNSSAQTTAPDDLDRILHEALADESLELPPPPQVVSEVLRLTRGEAAGSDTPDANSTELAQLIQRDMALASQVMRVANSAVYARRSPAMTDDRNSVAGRMRSSSVRVSRTA